MNDINLLPWREEKRQKKIRVALRVFVSGLFSIVLILSVSFVYLNKQVEGTREKIEINKQNALIWEKRQEKLKHIKELNQLLLSIKKNNNAVCKNLHMLFSKVPMGVRLTSCFLKQGVWAVEGEARDQSKLLLWAEYLKNSHFFTRLQFEKWKVDENVVQFSLKETGQ